MNNLVALCGPSFTGPFGTGLCIIWYRSVYHLVPVCGPFSIRPWSMWCRGVDHLLPVCGPFVTVLWTAWYRAMVHLLPVCVPFGIGPCIIWYRAVDHLLPGRIERINISFFPMFFSSLLCFVMEMAMQISTTPLGLWKICLA